MVKCLRTKLGWIHLPVLAWLCEPFSNGIQSECKSQEIKFISGRDPQMEQL